MMDSTYWMDYYSDLIAKMNDYFKVHSSILLRRRDLLHASQNVNEIAAEFACRLRRLVQDCAFKDDKKIFGMCL